MRRRKLLSDGITILELLIVILIIGILISLTISTVRDARERAQAVAIADGFKAIEKGLRMYTISEDVWEWWDDEELKGPDGESSIAYLIEVTSLGNYMGQVPRVQGFDDTFFDYDNDLDEYDGCGANSDGVNIQTPFKHMGVAQRVDDMLDDGDLACGKVRMDQQGELVYLLSRTSVVEYPE